MSVWKEWRVASVESIESLHGRGGGRSRSRAILAALAFGATACDEPPSALSVRAPAPTPGLTVNTAACGVEYVQASASYDSLLAANGIQLLVDTVEVCQTWTGTDYEFRTVETGGLHWVNGTPAPSEIGMEYQNGVVTPVDAAGAQSGTTLPTNSTLLEFIAADSATIAAVDDDPYFAVRAIGECDSTPEGMEQCTTDPPPDGGGDGGGGGGGGGGTCDPEVLICDEDPEMTSLNVPYRVGATSSSASASIASSAQTFGPHSSAAISPDEMRFRRHGIKRPGVRALVENAVEMGRSGSGRRRFEVRRGPERDVFTIDPRTGLLIRHEWAGPRGRGEMTRRWRRVAGGYVIAKIETEQIDVTQDGEELPSRTVTAISRVRTH